jgi:hypothetical protein
MKTGPDECHRSINKSMTCYTNKNGNKIRRSFNISAPPSANISGESHLELLLEKMENTLCVWLKDGKQKGLLATHGAVREKDMQFYTTTMHSVEEASVYASKGWFENFKQQISSHNMKRIEAAASSNHMAGI